jgi:hypothetical protein
MRGLILIPFDILNIDGSTETENCYLNLNDLIGTSLPHESLLHRTNLHHFPVEVAQFSETEVITLRIESYNNYVVCRE